MNGVQWDMLSMFLLVYIDDIFIFSETLEQHIQHVQLVLKWLPEMQSFVKTEKCEFHTLPFLV